MAKMKVWENGRIVSKPDTFVSTKAGSATHRRLRDPHNRRLSKRQINAALILAGVNDPDAFIEDAAAAIADETARALAVNDWRHAALFDRSHSLFSDKEVLRRMGKSPHDMDDTWSAAVELPR